MAKRLGKGFVEFFLKSDKFDKGARGVMKVLDRMKKGLQAASRVARNLLFSGAAAAAGLVKLAQRQIDAEAKLAAVLRATGEAAGFTTRELLKQAAALQKVTTFGDDVIINAQAILATFKEIKGDVFKGATEAMLDMATVMDGDLKGAAVQLGKALNDPVKGISALSRVGVSFTQQQKDQIAAFVEANDVMSAQQVILKELQGEFGGAAKAMAQTDTGKLKQALNELGDAGERFGVAITKQLVLLIPHLERLSDWVSKLTDDDIADFIEKAKLLGKILIGIWVAPKLIAGIQGFVKMIQFMKASVGGLVAGPLAALAAIMLVVAANTYKAIAAADRLLNVNRTAVELIRKRGDLQRQLAAETDPKARLRIQEQIVDARRREVDLARSALVQQKKLAEAQMNAAEFSKEKQQRIQDNLQFYKEAPGKALDLLIAEEKRLAVLQKQAKITGKLLPGQTITPLTPAIDPSAATAKAVASVAQIQMVGLEEQFAKLAFGKVDTESRLAEESNRLSQAQLDETKRMRETMERMVGPNPYGSGVPLGVSK